MAVTLYSRPGTIYYFMHDTGGCEPVSFSPHKLLNAMLAAFQVVDQTLIDIAIAPKGQKSYEAYFFLKGKAPSLSRPGAPELQDCLCCLSDLHHKSVQAEVNLQLFLIYRKCGLRLAKESADVSLLVLNTNNSKATFHINELLFPREATDLENSCFYTIKSKTPVQDNFKVLIKTIAYCNNFEEIKTDINKNNIVRLNKSFEWRFYRCSDYHFKLEWVDEHSVLYVMDFYKFYQRIEDAILKKAPLTNESVTVSNLYDIVCLGGDTTSRLHAGGFEALAEVLTENIKRVGQGDVNALTVPRSVDQMVEIFSEMASYVKINLKHHCRFCGTWFLAREKAHHLEGCFQGE